MPAQHAYTYHALANREMSTPIPYKYKYYGRIDHCTGDVWSMQKSCGPPMVISHHSMVGANPRGVLRLFCREAAEEDGVGAMLSDGSDNAAVGGCVTPAAGDASKPSCGSSPSNVGNASHGRGRGGQSGVPFGAT